MLTQSDRYRYCKTDRERVLSRSFHISTLGTTYLWLKEEEEEEERTMKERRRRSKPRQQTRRNQQTNEKRNEKRKNKMRKNENKTRKQSKQGKKSPPPSKKKKKSKKSESVKHELVSWLVSWCFKPNQPQGITSGLKTNLGLSPSYSWNKI